MNQICYCCGRELDRCECEEHGKAPERKTSRADEILQSDYQAYADNYDMEAMG